MKSIDEQAVENTQVVVGSNYAGYVTEQDGNPLTIENKTKPHNTLENTVGVSVGTTVNLGNYESYRIDVWATDHIRTGETAKQAITRVQKVLDNHIIDVRKSITNG